MSDVPHPIDTLVGAAVRRERKAAGWSQERLANAIGVSFQQLQKYERGVNRIGASRLHRICLALNIRVNVLFGEADSDDDSASPPVDARLVGQLSQLKPAGRRAVLSLVSALYDS